MAKRIGALPSCGPRVARAGLAVALLVMGAGCAVPNLESTGGGYVDRTEWSPVGMPYPEGEQAGA